MAWCVGSVFPNPHLLTGPAGAPLGSLLLDPPQCLLITGCAFRSPAHQQSDPHQQVESFLGEYKEAFFPQELLIENLREDVALHTAISQSYSSVGNRLEGLKNREGRLQLFFPVGENTDRIGSCILFPESNAALSKRNLCCDIDNNVLYSSSSSVRQPILQIAANKIGSSWDSELANVPLAARTLYQVHWLTSQIENDKNSIAWRGVENFDHGTSHVVWNPHFPGEAAVVLENGDVSIFDLNSPGSHAASCMFKVEECIDNENFSFSNHARSHKRKKGKETVQSSGSNNSANTSATQNWWTCEYAWHPKNLLVGGQMEIYLIDTRQKCGSKQFQQSIARVDCSSKLFSYCNQKCRAEHFTALTRSDYDNMFQFAAASTNHLTLYDVRRPNTPLLQWEHRMQLEPPRLLQMFCLSDVCSSFHDPLDKYSAGGRVILACAFKSGEMQAFLYGPKPQACASYSEGIKLEQSMGVVGILDKLYAWEFPKALKNMKVHCNKNLEHAFEAHENNLQSVIPKDEPNERLTGLLNLSPHSGSSSFTILQLTGSGSILSQSLKVSEEAGLSNHELPGAVSEMRTILKTSSRKWQYRMEYLPSFLKHLQYGSVLPNSRQNVYMSAIDHWKSNSANREECLKNETEEVHDSTSVDEAQDNMIRRQTPHSHHTAARSSLIGKDSQETPFQRNKSGNDGDQTIDDFFCKMDTQLSPVKLSFTDAAIGTNLQSEELVMLSGLKNLFQQWQQSFQPYIDYSSNHNCESL